MMRVNDVLLEKIKDCRWFENCGCVNSQRIGVPVKYVSFDEAKRQIMSLRWENICLRHRNEITSNLFQTFEDSYSQWNVIVDSIKKEHLNSILVKIEKALAE